MGTVAVDTVGDTVGFDGVEDEEAGEADAAGGFE